MGRYTWTPHALALPSLRTWRDMSLRGFRITLGARRSDPRRRREVRFSEHGMATASSIIRAELSLVTPHDLATPCC
jgi:hypothetical protein